MTLAINLQNEVITRQVCVYCHLYSMFGYICLQNVTHILRSLFISIACIAAEKRVSNISIFMIFFLGLVFFSTFMTLYEEVFGCQLSMHTVFIFVTTKCIFHVQKLFTFIIIITADSSLNNSSRYDKKQ